MSVQYHSKDFKTILNKLKFIDSWFWCRYTLNPYNGCEFACTYCDSRSHKYHLHPDFDQQIFIKTNIAKMLDDRISRARTLLPDVVAIGGTCDAYQPAEAQFRNSRQCLEVLHKYRYPVSLSTKSPLILRDLDLLSQIADQTWCTIGVTVTTLDEETARFLEPNAPDPQKRLDVVREIKRKTPQIQTGIHFMPIVPFLGDSQAGMEAVVRAAKENGADFLLFGSGMTMRDKQAAWFLKKIGERFPDLVGSFEKLYQGTYDPQTGSSGQYTPNENYARKINKQMIALCEKHKIAFRTRRYMPEDFRRLNYAIAENLLNESYLEQIQGRAWANGFWAGQNIQGLGESIADVAARGELSKIRNIGPALEAQILQWLKSPNQEALKKITPHHP